MKPCVIEQPTTTTRSCGFVAAAQVPRAQPGPGLASGAATHLCSWYRRRSVSPSSARAARAEMPRVVRLAMSAAWVDLAARQGDCMGAKPASATAASLSSRSSSSRVTSRDLNSLFFRVSLWCVRNDASQLRSLFDLPILRFAVGIVHSRGFGLDLEIVDSAYTLLAYRRFALRLLYYAERRERLETFHFRRFISGASGIAAREPLEQVPVPTGRPSCLGK